ncbi:MAG: hypothetical protein RLZZ628_2101 [Bacteroidota bacterium]|jgi:hypothetical protein
MNMNKLSFLSIIAIQVLCATEATAQVSNREQTKPLIPIKTKKALDSLTHRLYGTGPSTVPPPPPPPIRDLNKEKSKIPADSKTNVLQQQTQKMQTRQ